MLYLEDSYSLEGDDRICLSILRKEVERNNHKRPFFIDIGCNHPKMLSNTFLFYSMGFSGICIDPLPKFKNLFDEIRPRDVFIEAAISSSESTHKLIEFNDDGASSIHSDTIDRYTKKFKQHAQHTVRSRRLRDVLREIGVLDYSIPFVDIDVEGLDLEVLTQIGELPFKPLLICIESKLVNLANAFPRNEVDLVAEDLGYSLIAKTLLNSFYILRDSDAFDWIPREMRSLNPRR